MSEGTLVGRNVKSDFHDRTPGRLAKSAAQYSPPQATRVPRRAPHARSALVLLGAHRFDIRKWLAETVVAADTIAAIGADVGVSPIIVDAPLLVPFPRYRAPQVNTGATVRRVLEPASPCFDRMDGRLG